ncbi:MAG: hypothetical protein IPJ74_25825 [Saprospiraceae bacterium]|nr:hypothetical protein [Saprospiraceae bacterium]
MLDSQIEPLKEQQKQATDKAQKESLKTQIASLETQKESVRVLEDSDYIIFYLDEDLDKYKIAHQRYLAKIYLIRLIIILSQMNPVKYLA